MKLIKNFMVFIILIIVNSCNTQKDIFDIKYSNVAILEINKDSFKPFIYTKKINNLYVEVIKQIDFPLMKDWSFYFFTKNNDTMRVRYKSYKINDEYYLKDLKFKNGYYEIKFKKEPLKIEGKYIISNKRIRNIIFKNYIYRGVAKEKYNYSDIKLEDMKFKLIDFSDILNVKLIPISKEDFYK